MKADFSNVTQAMHEYLMWSHECDAKGWDEFSKGRCSEVEFTVALQIYSEEVVAYLDAN